MNEEIIVWSASWCAPCVALKKWIGTHYPEIKINDVDTGTAPMGVRSVPTLQVGEQLIPNTTAIKQWLGANYEN